MTDSVQLFVERARGVLPNFGVTTENRRAVAEICTELDGLPLAIELAAARIKILSPEQILHRLDQQFHLLRAGRRDAPARHQTLRRAVAWSYNLLTPVEQTLFCRLAVFVGMFTLDAVESICAEIDGDSRFAREPEITNVLECVASLVDKSLLQSIVQTEGPPRFALLETLRAYGREQLGPLDGGDRVHLAHARYFLSIAETEGEMFSGSATPGWLKQIALEYANLREALRWSIARKQTQIAARLGIALWSYWYVRGPYSEGSEWLEHILDLSPSTLQRGRLCYTLGMLARRRGKGTAMQCWFEKSLALFREAEDVRGIASAMRVLGFMHYVQGDYEQAEVLLRDGLLMFRSLDDVEGMAVTLTNLGYIANANQAYAEARRFQEESLALRRRTGNRYGISMNLSALAYAAIGLEEYDAAQRYVDESLELCKEIGATNGLGINLGIAGELALERGDLETAQCYLEFALALGLETNDKLVEAKAYFWLGVHAFDTGELTLAHHRLPIALRLFQEMNSSGSIMQALQEWSLYLHLQDQSYRAMILIGAVDTLRRTIGKIGWLPKAVRRFDRTAAEARKAVGNERADEAWQIGQAMSLEEAIAYTGAIFRPDTE